MADVNYTHPLGPSKVEERAAIEAEIAAGLAELDAGHAEDDETVRAMIRAYR